MMENRFIQRAGSSRPSPLSLLFHDRAQQQNDLLVVDLSDFRLRHGARPFFPRPRSDGRQNLEETVRAARRRTNMRKRRLARYGVLWGRASRATGTDGTHHLPSSEVRFLVVGRCRRSVAQHYWK
jgi:hypothetical protein